MPRTDRDKQAPLPSPRRLQVPLQLPQRPLVLPPEPQEERHPAIHGARETREAQEAQEDQGEPRQGGLEHQAAAPRLARRLAWLARMARVAPGTAGSGPGTHAASTAYSNLLIGQVRRVNDLEKVFPAGSWHPQHDRQEAQAGARHGHGGPSTTSPGHLRRP
jgi:hypothetical protein